MFSCASTIHATIIIKISKILKTCKRIHIWWLSWCRYSQVLRPHQPHQPVNEPRRHTRLQHSHGAKHTVPVAEQSLLEDWTAQGNRKSSQAAAWKTVSPAFVWTDATCSPFTSTPPTLSSSSRAVSVTCTTTSMMQAMASRWSAAVESLKVVRHDRQTVLPQQGLKPEHLQAEYRINGEKGGRER